MLLIKTGFGLIAYYRMLDLGAILVFKLGSVESNCYLPMLNVYLPVAYIIYYIIYMHLDRGPLNLLIRFENIHSRGNKGIFRGASITIALILEKPRRLDGCLYEGSF